VTILRSKERDGRRKRIVGRGEVKFRHNFQKIRRRIEYYFCFC
jgi:hypothetical protein